MWFSFFLTLFFFSIFARLADRIIATTFHTIDSCYIPVKHFFLLNEFVRFRLVYTPYSKMAAILVFFCFHANWPLWPRSRLNILVNFTFEIEVIRANLHGNKRTVKWQPFWNKVYY